MSDYGIVFHYICFSALELCVPWGGLGKYTYRWKLFPLELADRMRRVSASNIQNSSSIYQTPPFSFIFNPTLPQCNFPRR